MAGVQAGHRVQPVVAGVGQAFGAVVDVQHDGVEAQGFAFDHLGHILATDLGAWVEDRHAGFLAQRAAVPLDHPRHQFGHHHLAVLADVLQCRGQGKAHAQTADQAARCRATGDALAGDLRQGIFRAVHARVHQLAAVAALDLDHEVLAVLEQAQGAAVVGDRGGIEQDKALHGGLGWRRRESKAGSLP